MPYLPGWQAKYGEKYMLAYAIFFELCEFHIEIASIEIISNKEVCLML